MHRSLGCLPGVTWLWGLALVLVPVVLVEAALAFERFVACHAPEPVPLDHRLVARQQSRLPGPLLLFPFIPFFSLWALAARLAAPPVVVLALLPATTATVTAPATAPALSCWRRRHRAPRAVMAIAIPIIAIAAIAIAALATAARATAAIAIAAAAAATKTPATAVSVLVVPAAAPVLVPLLPVPNPRGI